MKRLACVTAVLLTSLAAAQPIVERESMPLGGTDETTPLLSGEQAPERSSVGELLTAAGPLALVLGLIAVVAIGGRAYAKSKGGLLTQMSAGGRAPAGILTVLGRYPVGRGQTYVLLRCDNRVLLICQTAGKAGTSATLAEFTDASEVASITAKAEAAGGNGSQAAFGSLLGSARGELETKPIKPTKQTRTEPARRVIESPEGDRVELLNTAPRTSGDAESPAAALARQLAAMQTKSFSEAGNA
ncbi:MAG: hypothetical protein AAGI17_09980 [Planctomycetota bacterium]